MHLYDLEEEEVFVLQDMGKYYFRLGDVVFSEDNSQFAFNGSNKVAFFDLEKEKAAAIRP